MRWSKGDGPKEGEEWRVIPRYPGYEASTLGRIRNVRTGYVLQPNPSKHNYGYLRVTFGSRDSRRKEYVHALVLETFHGPRPPRHVARHDPDHDPANNRPENLKWGTQKENCADMVRHGRSTFGERNPSAKLTKADVFEIRAERRLNTPIKVLAARFGVVESCISRVTTGNNWRHL